MQTLIQIVTIPATMAGIEAAIKKKESLKRQGYRVINATSQRLVMKKVIRT